ncbi:MAG: primosomal protein N' [Planctomycetota bacterium]|nr:MAG: primosomal protein N' [Planctomycetota bacterium]
MSGGGPFARVALALPLRREFHYKIPDAIRERVQPGSRVRLHFSGRIVHGFVVALDAESEVPESKLKELLGLSGDHPPLPESILRFTRALARACGSSWGTALEAAMPGSLKRGARRTSPGLELGRPEQELRFDLEQLDAKAPKRARALRAVLDLGSPVLLADAMRRSGLSRSPFDTLVKHGLLRRVRMEPQDELIGEARALETAPRHPLNPAQQAAVDRALESIHAERHESFLLHGITGSGKTEVYLRILEEVRALGRGAIILVPEIALTPQTVGRFLSRFPDIAVLHSSLTGATRARQWLRIARGEVHVVVGARSALFAPVSNLGLIVVDEEHESSFKQQNQPRYHAREMAVLRGRLENACVVLGSATPCLESWQRCESGEFTKLELPERVASGRLPAVQVVDMRHEKPVHGRAPLISRRLQILMQEQIEARQQVLLFLNRRGFSPVLWCPDCGETLRCPDCDVPMTWHARRGRLLCHYCMHDAPRAELCSTCKSPRLRPLGSGTERVEDVVKQLFPGAVVARMDSDTMATRDSYETVLHSFRRGDIDILIGTQMIAKGLDFPELTLVGVISADTGLFQPDFRAAERCFQILAQVAGRAGRGSKSGTVVLQTLCPEALPVERAAKLDYHGFVRQELEHRRSLLYPPFRRLLRLICESERQEDALAVARKLADELRRICRDTQSQVLGPAVAPLARVRGRYRIHAMVKCAEADTWERLLDFGATQEAASQRGVRVLLDPDPVSML